MDYDRILYQKIDDNIVKITLNRPEKRNAFDGLTQEELWDAFVQADLDEDVNVIVLSAAGKDFSAGMDISGKGEKARGTILGKVAQTKLTGIEKEIKTLGYTMIEQAKAIRSVSKPTIAMVQGRCIAGATILVAMCDLIVASEDVQFIDPISRWGSAGSELLHHPYSFGFRRAKEMIFTGDPVTAQEAKELGFVSRVVPGEQLEEETMKLARRIASNMPVALSLAKKSINQAWDLMGQRDAWEQHMLVAMLAHASDARKNFALERGKAMDKGGVKAVLETRDSKFKAGGKY